MKKIFICSPFRAKSKSERKRNIGYAQTLAKWVIDQGDAPYAPHLYLTDVLDDTDSKQRQRGISAGLAFMDVCDEIIVGCAYGISAGMRKEIACAKRKKIPVRYCDDQADSVTILLRKELSRVTFSIFC